jgi:hypothetical protein
LTTFGQDCLDDSIDFTVVDDLLTSADRSESIGSLRLLTVLLEHGLTDPARLADASFFRKILRLAQSGQQKAANSAAQCLGQMLKMTSQKGQTELTARMRQLLDTLLSELSVAGSAEDRSRFLRLLHGVQRAYPNILADFAGKFLYAMKAMSSEELSICLEMLITYSPSLVQERNYCWQQGCGQQ